MAVRGDEVSSSIDAHVREALERMVGEIRSSVEDVRAAVDSQLNAALQSMQADVKSLTFLPHIQKTIGELEETYAAAQPAAAPAGGGAAALKRAIQTVERGKSQVDLLNSFLEQCLDFGSRAALLILREGTFSGWKGVGFGVHGGNDELIKRFNAAPGLVPELDLVLRNEQVVVWDGASLASRLAGPTAPVKAVLVPMVIKDRVAAAVYVDVVAADEARLDLSSLEILVFTTGLLIDTLALRKKVPSPSLNEGGDAAAAAPAAVAAPAAAVAPPPAPAAVAAPRPVQPPPAAPAPAPAASASGDATIAVSAAQLREMMAAAAPTFSMPAADEFNTPAPRPAQAAPPPPPAVAPPPPAPAPTASPAAADETGARPSTQYVPPSGVGRNPLFGGNQSEDAKKHDEARRFARLLVSEIKLYNEAKVEQGRKNRDLYERLKEDIDRSRQMYDERIGDDVRKTSNYFYDELVRILADGHAESLGL
jgi:hypothetical protein